MSGKERNEVTLCLFCISKFSDCLDIFSDFEEIYLQIVFSKLIGWLILVTMSFITAKLSEVFSESVIQSISARKTNFLTFSLSGCRQYSWKLKIEDIFKSDEQSAHVGTTPILCVARVVISIGSLFASNSAHSILREWLTPAFLSLSATVTGQKLYQNSRTWNDCSTYDVVTVG